MVISLEHLQTAHREWSKKNFKGLRNRGELTLIGISEEVGELCHAHLKGKQNIRYSSDEIMQKKVDAIGDIIIFLIAYADSQGISVEDAVAATWESVSKRDYADVAVAND